MRSFINNYFGFNKQQRNGLLVLVLISFALLLMRMIYPSFIKPANIQVQNLPLIEQKVDSADQHGSFSGTDYAPQKKTSALFTFNPNTVSYDHLLALGFREKTAKTFIKFRDKGFVFKEKKDLQKIYGISEKFYAKLEPYVLIESSKTTTSEKKLNPVFEEKTTAILSQKTVDLNCRDTVALIQINGIGPSYARRILKYGAMLGGYVAVEQLKEVYGFSEELYEKVKPFVTVNPTTIKKINLNTDDFKTINKHPYLSYELTKSIFDWRRKTTINVTNLKTILNDEALYHKLLPYLILD